MRVKLLGTSAGGAFPQWNCACPNCRGLRSERQSAGTTRRYRARTQSQVAVSADGSGWLLLNASPDLRFQIEATPELQPRPGVAAGNRDTPILGVVLTNADLDHVLGLLLMRESQPYRVFATDSVRRVLTEDNSMFRMLEQKKGQVSWSSIVPGHAFDLVPGALSCTAYSIEAKYPIYVGPERASSLSAAEAVLGLVIDDRRTSRKFAHLPGIPELTEEWQKRLSGCDLVFCDGTFWDNDELKRISGATRTSREMGHIPMSGKDGSIEILSRLSRPKKVFTHINNTNPVLDERSEEFALASGSGIQVGSDGMDFEL